VKLFEKSYVSRSDLDADRLKAQRLEISWKQSITSLDLYVRYEFPKEAEKLFSDYLEAEREMERIYAQTRSKLAQAEARRNSSEAKYLLNKERFERIQKQLDACVMRATAPGMIIYASSSNRRWSGTRTSIDVGEDVRERELILTITNSDQMDIDVKVHETNIDKVRVGQAAQIKVDAQPDKIFRGTVLKIAPLPDPQSIFGNPDMKVYATDVSLETNGSGIKPGMSARIEILIAQLHNVLSIPIQCVANRSGVKVCYVMDKGQPRKVEIETGAFNDRFVEVVSGLQEGQQVLLNPPRLLSEASDSHTAPVASREGASPRPGDTPAADTAAGTADAAVPAESPAPSPGGGDMKARLQAMDKNGDGKISLTDEIPENAQHYIKPLDTNQDGFIDNAEMDAAPKTPSGRNRGGDAAPGNRQRGPRPESPS
jgi:multidrug efflux pump subunit AcrA (membrane-fusion protein)